MQTCCKNMRLEHLSAFMNKVRKGLRYGFDAADCLTGGAYSAPQGALAERYESCFAQRGLWGPYLSAALMTLQRGAGGQPLFSPSTLPPRLELKSLGQLLDSPAPAGCMMGWQRATLQCKSLLGANFAAHLQDNGGSEDRGAWGTIRWTRPCTSCPCTVRLQQGAHCRIHEWFYPHTLQLCLVPTALCPPPCACTPRPVPAAPAL